MRLTVILSLFLLTPVFLVSAEEVSENVCLFAVPKSFVTLPDISFESVKDKAVELAKSVPDKVDNVAIALADKLEESKKTPEIPTQHRGLTSVLGGAAEETEVKSENGTFDNVTAAAYNAGADVLSFLLRHWLWTLSGLGALAIFWFVKY